MERVITEELLERLRLRGTALLDQELFGARDSARGSQALGGGVLTEQLIWQVLVPLLVTIAGGLVVEMAKAVFARPASDPAPGEPHRGTARLLVNRPVRAITQTEVRECVRVVHEALEPYGAEVQKSERIVVELLKETRVEMRIADAEDAGCD
jgi:hypothetical protein